MSMNKNFRDKAVFNIPHDRLASCLRTACCILVVFLLFLFFRHLAPFVYQTNDDLFLRMIASGEISGTPESRLHFIAYPAGLLLSLLYRCFPSLPWYGLFLCCSFGFAMILILFVLLRDTRTWFGGCIAVILFCMLSCGFLFAHLAELQFTTSAGIAAAGALFLFIVSAPSSSLRETLKHYAGFFLLSAYAFCIRDQVLFMCFPFLGMAGLSEYLDAGKLPGEETSGKKPVSRFICKNKHQRNLLLLGVVFLAMLAALLLTEKIAYHGDDWRSFQSYSAARASVYDYEGYPDYDTYEATYRELGISRSSYEAAAHRYCLILDPAIDRHSMEVLENISRQERAASLESFSEKVRDMAAFFFERHRSDADKPLNLLVYRCYILFIACALFSRKWNALRDILFALFARMAIWAYLLFYGRLPVRISQSVYLAELAVLFAAAFSHRLWILRRETLSPDPTADPTAFSHKLRIPRRDPLSLSEGSPDQNRMPSKKETASGLNFISLREKLCPPVFLLSLGIILYTCVRSGIPNAKAAAETAAARLQFSESFTVMKDYFKAHPDCFYYLDTNSFAYFTEDALKAEEHADSNYLFMGGWAAKSPWYEKKMEKEQIADPAAALCEDPFVYAVFMNTEDTGYGYLEAFYAENYPDVRLEEVETVDAGGGVSFVILNAVPEKTP